MKKLLIGLTALVLTLGVMTEAKSRNQKIEFGINPFGDPDYPSDYENAHPWSVGNPNGYPLPHGAHGSCGGVTVTYSNHGNTSNYQWWQ